MATPEMKKLHCILMDAHFDFIPDGEIHVRNIYEIVKERYPDLCDDSSLCPPDHKNGYNYPEWKHVVRTALKHLKERGERVSTGNSRGMWLFGTSVSGTKEASECEAFEGRALLKLHKMYLISASDAYPTYIKPSAAGTPPRTPVPGTRTRSR